ncbi:MAG: D-alanyl-D-alanine carboxypeptidase [Clostridia bacterium]|nr:D-alanyl-D-alanine carboxypeptidase [Clostridia bacterium]
MRALVPGVVAFGFVASSVASASPYSWEDDRPKGLGFPVAAPAEPAPGAPGEAPAAAKEPPPRVTADAYVLMDLASGRVLAQRNAHERRAPASTTKIMTAVLAFELGRPDDVVVVSPAAAATPGSSAHLRPGDRYRLRDLVLALLLRSGNDAAVAIAQHLAGSVSAFAGLMNDEARLLGLRDTRFQNPHGLTAPGHYTSAYDLARLARYAMAFPEFRAAVARSEAEIRGQDAGGREIVRRLRNTNRLLAYGWVTGVKTGTTAAAGDCLVASGEREGESLVAVVLHSDDRWSDALALLDWGFREFEERTLATVDAPVARLPVVGGTRAAVAVRPAADLRLAVSRLEAPEVRVSLELPARVEAPVAAGAYLGRLVAWAGSERLGDVPLVAGETVARGRILRLFRPRPAAFP